MIPPLITEELGDDPETYRQLAELFESGIIPTKDHANTGPTNTDSIEWLRVAAESVKGSGFADAYPDVLSTTHNKYETK